MSSTPDSRLHLIFAIDAWVRRARDIEPVMAPGWPPSRRFPVRECLSVILSEEWEHRRYAARDLSIVKEDVRGFRRRVRAGMIGPWTTTGAG
jgi:hypothetical protein